MHSERSSRKKPTDCLRQVSSDIRPDHGRALHPRRQRQLRTQPRAVNPGADVRVRQREDDDAGRVAGRCVPLKPKDPRAGRRTPARHARQKISAGTSATTERLMTAARGGAAATTGKMEVSLTNRDVGRPDDGTAGCVWGGFDEAPRFLTPGQRYRTAIHDTRATGCR